MKKIAMPLIFLGIACSSYAQPANFGGCYGGVQAGLAQNTTIINDIDYWYTGSRHDSPSSVDPLAGLKFGCDFADGEKLYGYLIEGSVSSLDSQIEASSDSTNPRFKAGSKIDALGSVRGKLGMVSDKLAVFGTAGLAFANIKHKFNETDDYDRGGLFNGKGKSMGGVFGVGAAYALTDSTAIGFDVSRYSFGSQTHALLYSDGSDTHYKYGMKDRIDVISLSYTVKF